MHEIIYYVKYRAYNVKTKYILFKLKDKIQKQIILLMPQYMKNIYQHKYCNNIIHCFSNISYLSIYKTNYSFFLFWKKKLTTLCYANLRYINKQHESVDRWLSMSTCTWWWFRWWKQLSVGRRRSRNQNIIIIFIYFTNESLGRLSVRSYHSS